MKNKSGLILLACGWSGLVSHANPLGGTVVQGSASFNTAGSHLTVSTSDRAYINWQSFNIGVGQTTTFVQPSDTSLVWNQINDPNPSQILGNLNANGYVVLQNQNGFYLGGQAAITTHGLMMTTAPIAAPDLSSGGAWSFSAPPPTASIVNYGQININGGSSAFLIAHDIENHGSITAPAGNIGLYAGQQVLVSTRPDGRGLSAAVTLPQGSVDNQGRLIADGGSIAMRAQVVNQGGLVQANSVQNQNGVIELIASDAVNLGANSVISAQGDAQGASAGGSVIIKSDNIFSDQPTSVVNISGGAQGGNGGQAEISAGSLNGVQSRIDGHAAAGFLGGTLNLDPVNLTLNSAFVSSLTPTLNSGLYQINLQADNTITLSTLWALTDPGAAAALTLTAGNNIIFNNGSGIRAGNNWSVNLSAGPLNLAAKPTTARTDGIYLDGNSLIETLNGNINLWAVNEVLVNSGAIRTRQGGSINVTTKFGDVNSGNNLNGYVFSPINKPTPLYTVSPNLGGISTAAGGDVTINAGGNVISYLPTQADYDANRSRSDNGSGAFGAQPGNVTITAGGKVTGHYVLANGVGSITANHGNIGNPLQQGGGLALSLVNGSWDVSAPNGSIYLQEVRNPNGIFNVQGGSFYSGFHYFDYNPQASVTLQAKNAVEITGGGPRPANTPIPILLPPSLTVSAGAGGFVLDANVILFPSPDQGLNLSTTAGGNFEGNNFYLAMSDSAKRQWSAGAFLSTDHAATPPGLNNTTPVDISISGSMNNAAVYTTKATQITVGGDLINSSFLGENHRAGDVTSITVAGKIYNTPSLNFVNLPNAIVSAYASDPTRWDSVFEVAVDPSIVASLDVSQLHTAAAIKSVLLDSGSLLFPQIQSRFGLGGNPGFVYDPSTHRLGFNGSMSALSAQQLSALQAGVFTVLVLDSNGNPVVDPANSARLLTKTYTFLPPTVASTAIGNLYAESLLVPAFPAHGFQIGGPGQFNITAASMELGNTDGVLSWGIGNGKQAHGLDYSSLAGVPGAGAEINVTLSGDLSMLTSRIASMYGGDVNVTSTGGSIDLGSQNFFITSSSPLAYGIFTSGHSSVNVVARQDVNINGSRIAAYNGGNILVESLDGNVNAGSGGNTYVNVPIIRPGRTQVNVPIYGSGILALSLPTSYQTGSGAIQPGNITVNTPHGDIISSQAGILQLALNGNVAGGPTVTLTAGTPASGGNPAIPGNIDLGSSGLIGGTVKVTAEGDIKGLIISRQNSDISAAQNFSGTLLSAGTASVAAGGTVAGTVIGVGGANVSGAVTAEVLGQNVSVNGGSAQSTLGTTATATAASQSAANQASSDSKEQVVAQNSDDDEKKKKGKGPVLSRRVSRVTVILPSKS